MFLLQILINQLTPAVITEPNWATWSRLIYKIVVFSTKASVLILWIAQLNTILSKRAV